MSWIDEAATAHRTTKERREFVGKAKDKFIDASSQAPDDYRKALAQDEVGNCWVALGSNEDGRIWFQRAQASAMTYLKGSLRKAAEVTKESAAGEREPRLLEQAVLLALLSGDPFTLRNDALMWYLTRNERRLARLLAKQMPGLSVETPAVISF